MRLNKRQATSAISHIDTVKILKKFQDHVLDGKPLEMSQIRAGEALLARTVPTLTASTLTAEITETPRTPEELIAQGRMHGLTPEQLFGRTPRK